jgi:hypothetical protein
VAGREELGQAGSASQPFDTTVMLHVALGKPDKWRKGNYLPQPCTTTLLLSKPRVWSGCFVTCPPYEKYIQRQLTSLALILFLNFVTNPRLGKSALARFLYVETKGFLAKKRKKKNSAPAHLPLYASF